MSLNVTNIQFSYALEKTSLNVKKNKFHPSYGFSTAFLTTSGQSKMKRTNSFLNHLNQLSMLYVVMQHLLHIILGYCDYES